MRCTNIKPHEHPPVPVTVADKNPTEPRGLRPVHCPECSQANRPDKVARHWTTYESEEEIYRVLQKRPHHTCL